MSLPLILDLWYYSIENAFERRTQPKFSEHVMKFRWLRDWPNFGICTAFCIKEAGLTTVFCWVVMLGNQYSIDLLDEWKQTVYVIPSFRFKPIDNCSKQVMWSYWAGHTAEDLSACLPSSATVHLFTAAVVLLMLLLLNGRNCGLGCSEGFGHPYLSPKILHYASAWDLPILCLRQNNFFPLF